MMTWESRPIDAGNDAIDAPDYSLPNIIRGRLRRLPAPVRQGHRGHRTAAGDPARPRDERHLVPVVGDRRPGQVDQRQQRGRLREDVAARARHLPAGGREQPRHLGLGAEHRQQPAGRRTRLRATSTRSTPATTTSTGSGSPATCGRPTRRTTTSASTTRSSRASTQLRSITKKPIVLAEVGASETDGHKPAWITSLLRGARQTGERRHHRVLLVQPRRDQLRRGGPRHQRLAHRLPRRLALGLHHRPHQTRGRLRPHTRSVSPEKGRSP